MGVSVDSGGGGGRKKVDADLNLVPFIDLLSVCILFLLMTAVWVHISKMAAFSQPSGEAIIAHSEVSSINKAKEERDFDFLVRQTGVEIKEDGRSLGEFKLEIVNDKILELKGAWKTEEMPKISLRAADDVVYEDLIFVLDLLFNSKWTNVSVGGL